MDDFSLHSSSRKSGHQGQHGVSCPGSPLARGRRKREDRKRMMKLRAAVLAVSLVVAGASIASGDPTTLRVGWVSGSSDVPLVTIGPKDILRHEGKSYVIE